ncbi:MAG: polysaccharide biosynthesis protein [Flavobacteriales bacterium]|nr:polysaccharide biosynthesis protein [Flavobacteriales bacterium]
MQLNIPDFIKEKVTFRKQSYFLNDLTRYDSDLSNAIDGKNVLVIGGAGTIGSSYIKALLKFKPAKLYVIDINENGLTELVRDLRSSDGLNIPSDFITYPINFGDPVFTKLFLKEGPWHIVANFAAHKHVRSEKDAYSIEAMLDNNLFKAEKLLKLLSDHKPEHFFCVSTDKAANPVNIMGASKKLMENLIIAYSGSLKINTARFANVAFSNGSLLAGYIERVMKRQPLSCPSDIKRFFVSPEESGQICLMANILGKSGQIFFPKFDFEKDQTYFKDITIRFIESLGLRPDLCSSESEAIEKSKKMNGISYPVYFFESDTSGEKTYEEFYTEDEEKDLTKFESLGIITPPEIDLNQTLETIHKLRMVFETPDLEKSIIVDEIKKSIPDFNHIETGKNLDQKM